MPTWGHLCGSEEIRSRSQSQTLMLRPSTVINNKASVTDQLFFVRGASNVERASFKAARGRVLAASKSERGTGRSRSLLFLNSLCSCDERLKSRKGHDSWLNIWSHPSLKSKNKKRSSPSNIFPISIFLILIIS